VKENGTGRIGRSNSRMKEEEDAMGCRRMYYEVEDCGVEEEREGSVGYRNPWEEDLRRNGRRRGKRRKWSSGAGGLLGPLEEEE